MAMNRLFGLILEIDNEIMMIIYSLIYLFIFQITQTEFTAENCDVNSEAAPVPTALLLGYRFECSGDSMVPHCCCSHLYSVLCNTAFLQVFIKVSDIEAELPNRLAELILYLTCIQESKQVHWLY